VLLLVDGTDWSVMVPGGRAILRRCLKLLTRHYPERLGAALVLRPPRLFGALWHVMTPFLDNRTVAKVTIVPGNEPLRQREYLATHFGDLGDIDVALGGDNVDAKLHEQQYDQRMRAEDARRAGPRSSTSTTSSAAARVSSPVQPRVPDTSSTDEEGDSATDDGEEEEDAPDAAKGRVVPSGRPPRAPVVPVDRNAVADAEVAHISATAAAASASKRRGSRAAKTARAAAAAAAAAAAMEKAKQKSRTAAAAAVDNGSPPPRRRAEGAVESVTPPAPEW
jgi:hypothetical protein